MKHVCILSLAIAVVVFSAATGVLAQSMCSFRSPETSVLDSTMSFAYRYYDRALLPGVEENSGWVSVTYDRLFDSPDFGYSVDGGSTVLLADWVATAWIGHGSAAYRYYISDRAPLYVYGRVIGQTDVPHPMPNIELRSGVGVGRFTDVTALAKAARIERLLVEAGLLSTPMTQSAIDDVAALIANRTVEMPIEAVVERIERAVAIDLDAATVLAILEEIERSGNGRYCGWLVQAGVGYELVDRYGGSRDTLYTMAGDFAYVVNPDSQIRIRSSLSTPTTLRAENHFSVSVSLESTLPATRSIRASYDLSSERRATVEPLVIHRADINYLAKLGKVDCGIRLGLTHASNVPRWTVDLSAFMAIDLL